MIVHLSIGVKWNPSCTKNTLTKPLCLPYEINITIVFYAQLCRLSVEDEWLESARDRALSIDRGPIWFSKMIKWLA
jgi:hypothetical protein